MNIYFWILRIAAFFGHRKARKLVHGQARALGELQEWAKTLGGSGVLWFHAASVGEFEQARPIIERLQSELPFRKVLLTFFSLMKEIPRRFRMIRESLKVETESLMF